MFHRCKSLDEGKALFRKLAMRLHPDYGGSNEMMILLNESKEMFDNFIQKKEPSIEKAKRKDNVFDKVVEDVYFQDDRLEIIDRILKFAENNKSFDPSFAAAMLQVVDDRGFLTSNQYNALVNVYYKWNMDDME